MKKSVCLLLLSLIPNGALAKCWSVSELPPTFCAVLTVEQVVERESCVVRGKLLQLTVPMADLQNLKWAEALKNKSTFSVKLRSEKCDQLKAGDVLKGMLLASCNDTGHPSKHEYVYYGEKEVLKTPVGVGGKEVSVTCKGF